MKASILYSLFKALRSEDRLVAGGIGEYLLLEEYVHKFELNNFEDFVFACEILLVKNKSEQQVFRKIINAWRVDIEKYIDDQKAKITRLKDPQLLQEATPGRPIPVRETARQARAASNTETTAPEAPAAPQQQPENEGTIKANNTVQKRSTNEGDSHITITLADETKGQSAAGTAFKPEGSASAGPVRNFLLGNEYFPIANRSLRQNWRTLKNRQEINQYGTIDLMATIDEITRTGFFRGFEYQKQVTNLLSLFIFIDRGSSMAAAASFGKELVESALQSGIHLEIKPWYFHDVPDVVGKGDDIDYMLVDEKEINAIRISKLFKNLNKKNIVALIYSDAGALSLAGNDQLVKREKKTKLFLRHLVRNTAYTAWLNPAPQHRWQGTIADNIANAFPEAAMFEANSTGFERTVNALRGKIAIK